MTAEQAAVCARFGVRPVSADLAAKVGISRSVRDGQIPLNSLRHNAEEGTEPPRVSWRLAYLDPASARTRISTVRTGA